MMDLMARWPVWVRSVVVISVAVASWVIRRVVHATTDSVVINLGVSVCLLALLIWVGLASFRLALREGEVEAKRNPRPW